MFTEANSDDQQTITFSGASGLETDVHIPLGVYTGRASKRQKIISAMLEGDTEPSGKALNIANYRKKRTPSFDQYGRAWEEKAINGRQTKLNVSSEQFIGEDINGKLLNDTYDGNMLNSLGPGKISSTHELDTTIEGNRSRLRNDRNKQNITIKINTSTLQNLTKEHINISRPDKINYANHTKKKSHKSYVKIKLGRPIAISEYMYVLKRPGFNLTNKRQITRTFNRYGRNITSNAHNDTNNGIMKITLPLKKASNKITSDKSIHSRLKEKPRHHLLNTKWKTRYSSNSSMKGKLPEKSLSSSIPFNKLDKNKEQVFILLLKDLNFRVKKPKHNGIRLIKQMKKNPKFANLLIVSSKQLPKRTGDIVPESHATNIVKEWWNHVFRPLDRFSLEVTGLRRHFVRHNLRLLKDIFVSRRQLNSRKTINIQYPLTLKEVNNFLVTKFGEKNDKKKQTVNMENENSSKIRKHFSHKAQIRREKTNRKSLRHLPSIINDFYRQVKQPTTVFKESTTVLFRQNRTPLIRTGCMHRYSKCNFSQHKTGMPQKFFVTGKVTTDKNIQHLKNNASIKYTAFDRLSKESVKNKSHQVDNSKIHKNNFSVFENNSSTGTAFSQRTDVHRATGSNGNNDDDIMGRADNGEKQGFVAHYGNIGLVRGKRKPRSNFINSENFDDDRRKRSFRNSLADMLDDMLDDSDETAISAIKRGADDKRNSTARRLKRSSPAIRQIMDEMDEEEYGDDDDDDDVSETDATDQDISDFLSDISRKKRECDVNVATFTTGDFSSKERYDALVVAPVTTGILKDYFPTEKRNLIHENFEHAFKMENHSNGVDHKKVSNVSYVERTLRISKHPERNILFNVTGNTSKTQLMTVVLGKAHLANNTDFARQNISNKSMNTEPFTRPKRNAAANDHHSDTVTMYKDADRTLDDILSNVLEPISNPAHGMDKGNDDEKDTVDDDDEDYISTKAEEPKQISDSRLANDLLNSPPFISLADVEIKQAALENSHREIEKSHRNAKNQLMREKLLAKLDLVSAREKARKHIDLERKKTANLFRNERLKSKLALKKQENKAKKRIKSMIHNYPQPRYSRESKLALSTPYTKESVMFLDNCTTCIFNNTEKRLNSSQKTTTSPYRNKIVEETAIRVGNTIKTALSHLERKIRRVRGIEGDVIQELFKPERYRHAITIDDRYDDDSLDDDEEDDYGDNADDSDDDYNDDDVDDNEEDEDGDENRENIEKHKKRKKRTLGKDYQFIISKIPKDSTMRNVIRSKLFVDKQNALNSIQVFTHHSDHVQDTDHSRNPNNTEIDSKHPLLNTRKTRSSKMSYSLDDNENRNEEEEDEFESLNDEQSDDTKKKISITSTNDNGITNDDYIEPAIVFEEIDDDGPNSGEFTCMLCIYMYIYVINS